MEKATGNEMRRKEFQLDPNCSLRTVNNPVTPERVCAETTVHQKSLSENDLTKNITHKHMHTVEIHNNGFDPNVKY